MKNTAEKLKNHPLPGLICLAVILTLAVEILSRRSLPEGVSFIWESPLMFGLNSLIVLTTLSLSLLTSYRSFITFLISTFWIVLGIINCVLMSFRVTPLTAIDLAILKSVLSIIQVYLSPIEIAAVFTALALVIALLVFAAKKMPKTQGKPMAKHISATTVIALFVVSGSMIITNAAAPEDGFDNLPDAYEDYGFAYCFSASFMDQGIDEPEDYSEEIVEETIDDIEAADTPAPEEQEIRIPENPNIIMVQLESFFDVHRLKEVEFSENPIPVFSHLQRELGSGFMEVPSIGSGTANTEFEILSGMNLDFFGAGEYPYQSVLMDQTCESICYNLKELGYTSHAIHNHQGSFYDRHIVFQNLGFDTFTSLEYMVNAEPNPIGWAKDQVLTEEILKALDSTDDQDFIYTISVQAHGKYPNEVKAEFGNLQLENPEELPDEEKEAAFEYYLSQIQESDLFIGELIEELKNYKEPVVLVFYGDHLPSLGLENEDLTDKNRLQTEYIIWNNFGLKTEAKDLKAYQLTAHLLNQLGIEEGTLTQLHQNMSGSADYQDFLELLQYDMLYGNKDIYDGESPFLPTKLKMGIHEICITSVAPFSAEYLYVRGENFTPFSKVCVDGEEKETHYLDPHTLAVKNDDVSPGCSLTIAQIAEDGVILSTSEEWIY